MDDRGKYIFVVASSYSRAAKHLNQESQVDIGLYVPGHVNAALAIELYFKSLYYIVYKKDFRHSHDFLDLFNELPSDIQDKLESAFSRIIDNRDMSDVSKIEAGSKETIPLDLKGNLDSWSSVFVKMRYIYDKPNKAISMMFFPEIEKILRDEITTLRPDLLS